MAGLDPAIHVKPFGTVSGGGRHVDARVKRGHDEGRGDFNAQVRERCPSDA
ncbi:MAG: hypothetical protein NVV74_01420 [Magnetospirillum sp.]|nr:hypothetical protein [Magnetospirillum sp.]